MVKFVLLDMDGTLCDKEGNVPARFKEVVKQLNEKGISIGIATGRDQQSVRHNFPDYFDEMACVTLNGSLNIYKGKMISSQVMDPTAIKKALSIIQGLEDASAQIFHTDNSYQKAGQAWYHQWFKDRGFKFIIKENIEFDFDNVVFITVTTYDLKTNHLDLFTNIDNLQAIYSGSGCVDISNIGISKRSGMLEMTKYLDITADEVMAVGDGGNDIELLKGVGVPVAMKNATEEVKSIAKIITEKPNTEEGCIEFLIKYFNLNI